ncbi:DNA polymerase III subunit gamma/tau, partial [Vibrio sp. 10N.261.52.A1]|uniref:DNA polymerase III subunit gamma/tau n=1 Tax=Vibrio sp. 10N.261.52.A1 TaxID=1880849 RepID=UPI000CB626D1
MSYLALARKWRPTKFKEVVGQAHVLTALENALSQNRLHHAYLFSGTRGVGKTTIGRLFAKGLNCETGITSTPCGECATCKEIDEGRFVDLLEIDAASRTKVEDTRELLDNVQYKPARGRFKVYLIDEVHMLSRHSFNALLKTLEEPPEYVKFLLATTDPQKLPVTILSRCLQFHLKPISVDNIHEQLDHILEQEKVTSESRALGMIAHAADGSMRDALSLTDQAIALGNGNVVTDTVAHMLGTLDTDQAIHLLEAISSKQPQEAMACIQNLAENGVEWDGLLNQLAVQLHRLAMYQALPSTLDKAQPDAEKLELLSKALSPQDIQLYYQIVLKGREDLPLSPTARVCIE